MDIYEFISNNILCFSFNLLCTFFNQCTLYIVFCSPDFICVTEFMFLFSECMLSLLALYMRFSYIIS